MGNIQFFNNKILFVGRRIAMAPACCCGGTGSCHNCASNSDEFDATIGEIVAFGTTGGGYVYCTDDDCDVFNGTFRLARATGPGEHPCKWRYLFPERYPEDPLCLGGYAEFGVAYHYWPYSLELSWVFEDRMEAPGPKYYPILDLLFHRDEDRADFVPWPKETPRVRWDLPEGIDDCNNVSDLELENTVLTQGGIFHMCRWTEGTALVNSV